MAKKYVLTHDGSTEIGSATARLRAPYRVLEAIFGDAGDEEMDGGKVTTAWMVRDAREVFLVHDRQDEDDRNFSVEKFRARASYPWHVDGPSEKSVRAFCVELAAEVRAHVRERGGRKLTDASKVKIQALIAAGKSAGEATALAAEWEPAVDERVFAWPIEGAIEDL